MSQNLNILSLSLHSSPPVRKPISLLGRKDNQRHMTKGKRDRAERARSCTHSSDDCNSFTAKTLTISQQPILVAWLFTAAAIRNRYRAQCKKKKCSKPSGIRTQSLCVAVEPSTTKPSRRLDLYRENSKYRHPVGTGIALTETI
uniref:Uncharacterized protein n=1 Tax=Rhipicephalus zambeziensis TaxID=60191 RepID=A0A224Y5N2_9ACAR